MEKQFADFLCMNHIECNSGHQKNYAPYSLTDRFALGAFGALGKFPHTSNI